MKVFSEELARQHVDQGDFWPLEQEYEEAGSLVGGFAKLGGRRLLLLGARSHFGIRSFAAAARARELLKIARRTSSAAVLIFGRKFQQETAYHDTRGLRARMDFLNELRTGTGVQINVITHVEGLQSIDVNSAADAVIFVNFTDMELESEQLKFAQKNAAFIASSLEEAFDTAHRIINYLKPLDDGYRTARDNAAHVANDAADGVRADDVRAGGVGGGVRADGVVQIPEDIAQPYDMKSSVIEPLFDAGSFLEFYREMNDPVRGPSLITGFAKLNGRTVGVLADQPAVMGGAPDAPGTEKFRVFVQLLNKHDVPLVMLSNAPGFMPGTRQERLRIQAIGGESLDVNILGRIPAVSVALNQNYGGRQIHAFSKYLRPGVVYITLDRTLLAVMGAAAAFDLFQGAKFHALIKEGRLNEAARLHREFFEDFNNKSRATNDAMNTGVIDWTVSDVKELRPNLIRGLELAVRRRDEAFGSTQDR